MRQNLKIYWRQRKSSQVKRERQMQPWIHRYHGRDGACSRSRHNRDSIRWIPVFLCDLAELQTTGPWATLGIGPGETPHLSLGLWFLVCTMVLEVEELFKTALDMREGFGLPHELSDHIHSWVSLVPSALTGRAVRRGQGQVSED